MTYEWRDPWSLIDQAERYERDWYDREDEHRLQMRGAALAFADASHQMRAQMEAAWDPIVRSKALQSPPPIVVSPAETARYREILK